MSQPTCRICSGPLELRFAGTGAALTSNAFVPTNHRPGEHGDLFECRHCGTVQQPALPSAGELAELYRGMTDDDYLSEEEGRRATAERLLDLIAKHVGAGALLDVGCGHGLLLDEARRRGYEVTGLELSEGARRHAREQLGLEVRDASLEEFAGADQEDRYQIVVLADVLEHLDDPVAGLRACRRLLAPGGVLCVVTPDVSAPLARLAGKRWWGLVPAHTVLPPRRTLLELLSADGLVVSEDVALVRSFALRYWLQGLAERGGSLGAALRALAARPWAQRSVSLSLGDERVVLAHDVRVAQPAEPLVRPRGGDPRVHVVLPAYKAADTVAQVAHALPVEAADRALLVDDASPDSTAEAALAAGLEVLRHPSNRGYGANQKTCYVRAILDGADIVVMVHADNQYDPALVAQMVKPIEAGIADVVMGSRLLEDGTVAGGMPRWKWVGNRMLTAVENLAFRRGYSEYHTGYRAFSTDLLREVAFLRNSDAFVFDQEIFAQLVASRARVLELPIPTRYFLEASTVSFRASVAYGLRTLLVLARFRLDERRSGWTLLRPPAVRLAEQDRDAVEAR